MLMHAIAEQIAAKKPTLFRRAFVFAGSFDPFAMHHREIVEQLLALRALMLKTDPAVPVDVVVWPVGSYANKQQAVPAEDRRAMLEVGLSGLDVTKKFDDLEHDVLGYTSTYQMQAELSRRVREDLCDEYFVYRSLTVLTEVWHVIGADNVDVIKEWNEGHRVWRQARFIVIARPGYETKELPPKSIVLEMGIPKDVSCTSIRKLIAEQRPWEHLVPQPVAAYIRRRNLYQPAPQRSTS